MLQGTYFEVEHPDYHHQHNQHHYLVDLRNLGKASFWRRLSTRRWAVSKVPTWGVIIARSVTFIMVMRKVMSKVAMWGVIITRSVTFAFIPANDNTGCFFNWYPPKKLKYGKPRLGESTLT